MAEWPPRSKAGLASWSTCRRKGLQATSDPWFEQQLGGFVCVCRWATVNISGKPKGRRFHMWTLVGPMIYNLCQFYVHPQYGPTIKNVAMTAAQVVL